MHKKLWTRLLLLSLAVLMFCPMLAACGDNPQQSSTDSDPNPTNPSTQETETPSTTKNLTAEEIIAASPHLVGATDQKNSRLVVFDLNKGALDDPDAVVWEYKENRVRQAAGIKFRHNDLFGGDVVLFCGPEGAGIISYETKKMLFFTPNVGSNPHTVELLPDGTFLVGATNGQTLHFFDAPAGNKRATYVLNWPCDVHGVLWDPEYDVLWVAGGNQVKGYRVENTPAEPKVTAISNYTSIFERGAIHDLAPVYGDTSKLWVTAVDGVVQLDKETMEHTKTYRGGTVVGGATYTPGVGNYPDGIIVYVWPNGCFQEWNTDYIGMFVPLTDIKHKKISLKSTTDAYYKIRVFCTDYQ